MNLTEEQIEAAAKAMYCTENMVNTVGTTHSHSWERASIDRDGYRKMAEAAAPFLQAQWEMPTTAEVNALHGRLKDIHLCDDREHVKRALQKFIESRNASLIPKPVDPRREKVLRTLLCNVAGSHDLQVVTDRILAALDAKE